MKKYFLAVSLCLGLFAMAQKAPQKNPVKAKTPTTTNTTTLKNADDSLSYAIGMSVSEFWVKQQGLKKLNPALLSKAINDALAAKKSLMTDKEANLALMCNSNPPLC